jgi:hypothetical protein
MKTSNEQGKHQVKLFESYLNGRIKQLEKQDNRCNAASESCEMAIAELQYIYDEILPELVKTIS